MPGSIPFEIHVTPSLLSGDREAAFIRFCERVGVKPVLIGLARGAHPAQSMASAVVHATSLAEALAAVQPLIAAMKAEFTTPHRIKAEVPDTYAHYFPAVPGSGAHYFEWHGKVPFINPDALISLCEKHGAHLSKNALRKSAGLRFVTLRETGAHALFQDRVDALVSALADAGWPVEKAHAEYCVYDTWPQHDQGWLSGKSESRTTGIDDERYPELLACEAFIRSAAHVGAPFMLRGSFLSRQYFPPSVLRVPGDLDWLMLGVASSLDEAQARLDAWAIAVTEVALDDGVRFPSFTENAFWRDMDYCMDGDFPTVNTDLVCWVDGAETEISVDVSFNLPVAEAPVPVVYKPLRGETFTVPLTAPLSLQVAWKIHQTLVRPRFKDLFDLQHLVPHPAFDDAARAACLQALVDECAVDGVDIAKLHAFLSADLERLFGADLEGHWESWRFGWPWVRNGHSINIHPNAAESTSAPDVPSTIGAFRAALATALEAGGLSTRVMDSLPAPRAVQRPSALRRITVPTAPIYQPALDESLPEDRLPARPGFFQSLLRLFR